MFSKSSENHQQRDTSSEEWGEVMCSQNICEYWGGFGKLKFGITLGKSYWPSFLMHWLKSDVLKHSVLLNC